MHDSRCFALVDVTNLQPGQTVLGWDDGDPFSAVVDHIEARPLPNYSGGPIEWVTDVHYVGGLVTYCATGVRKVRRDVS